MTSLEEFDIRESFDSLDAEKIGLLSMEQFYTLYLGLGYKPQLSMEDLKARVQALQQEDLVTVEATIQILSEFSRDREAEMSGCFNLVDHDKKGYISVQDIERLSVIVGEPMALDEAQTLLKESSRGSDAMIRERDFNHIFSPP